MDHNVEVHEQNFRDLFSKVNSLAIEAKTFLTTKAAITYFLGVLVTLTGTFITMSYMQNQVFLEIRKQDQEALSIYQASTEQIVSKLKDQQIILRERQDAVRTKLMLIKTP